MTPCPPVPLTMLDMERGWRRFRGGGSNTEAKHRRRQHAEKLRPALPSFLQDVRGGRHRFSRPRTCVNSKGRTITVPSPVDAILLASILEHLARVVNLPGIAPQSSLLCNNPGTRAFVLRLRKKVLDLAAYHGTVTVCLADIRKAFRSLNARKALELALAGGFPPEAVSALAVFYRLVHRTGLTGIAEGPCVSPLLAELCLLALDRILSARALWVGRYADNIVIVIRGRASRLDCLRLLAACFLRYDHQHGTALEFHKVHVSVFTRDQGFEQTLRFLGLRFVGHDCLPLPSKVGEAREKIIRALEEGKPVAPLIAGCLSFYRGIVRQEVIKNLDCELINMATNAMNSPASTSTDNSLSLSPEPDPPRTSLWETGSSPVAGYRSPTTPSTCESGGQIDAYIGNGPGGAGAPRPVPFRVPPEEASP